MDRYDFTRELLTRLENAGLVRHSFLDATMGTFDVTLVTGEHFIIEVREIGD